MELTAAEIEAIITKAVKAAISEKVIACTCGLPVDAQRELPHLMGVVKSIGGEGSDGYAKGIEILRENNRFVIRWRQACEKTGSIVLRVTLLGILALVGTICGLGWWSWIGKGIEK